MKEDDRVFEKLYELAAGRVNRAARQLTKRMKPAGGGSERDAAEAIWLGLIAVLRSWQPAAPALEDEVAALVRRVALGYRRAQSEMRHAPKQL